jgi:nucleolar pre-ribosomal-associated protein 2
LEEAQRASSNESISEASSTSAFEDEDAPHKASKKRKHTGELVSNPISERNKHLPDLMDAIFSVMDLMIQSTQYISETSKNRSISAFSAEYMKTVIRTAAKDAAIILGSWLSLCETGLRDHGFDKEDIQNWISPFVDIWNTHIADDNSLMQFSLYCTQPVLSLLRAVKDGKYLKIGWAPQLEQLLSRNIMNPAKAARWEDTESELLSTLTKISVLQDTANAPRLFEIAIRSIQPHGSRRRRASDDTWLQTVFKTLKDAMPPQNAAGNGKDIGSMLQCAIDYKVGLDLSELRIITSEIALLEGLKDWGLLATIIKLDSNVFLIPNDEQDLLKDLLGRITKASIDPSWPELSVQVVPDILVPLMIEFAKARDLSGFLRHWFAQLVEFDRLRNEAMLFSLDTFGAWEDEALQAQLSNLLEASLTVQQITQILDWLSVQVTEYPDAVCVLLEAIAGSIHQEEVVDALGLRLYRIMFESGVADQLDRRYTWRSWRILSRSLNWIMAPQIEELSQLWEQGAKPFNSLSSGVSSSFLLEMYSGNTVGLDSLEIIRFVCSAWEAAGKETRMENLARPYVLNILRRLAQDIRCFPQDLQGDTELGSEVCGAVQNTLYRGIGWMIWSFTKCVFLDYPKTIE